MKVKSLRSLEQMNLQKLIVCIKIWHIIKETLSLFFSVLGQNFKSEF